jgi:SAM-dependent methyltransferase
MERAHPDGVMWGVDISTASLAWARANLPRRLRLVQGTLVPALPIPDGVIDIVFAGSVFTHVREFEESLLFELLRIVRPGGLLLLSIHPERAWLRLGTGDDPGLANVLTAVPHRAEPIGVESLSLELFRQEMPSERVVITNTTYPVNNHYTFHKRSWIERHWAAHAELVDIVEEGHGTRQDLVVLRR